MSTLSVVSVVTFANADVYVSLLYHSLLMTLETFLSFLTSYHIPYNSANNHEK